MIMTSEKLQEQYHKETKENIIVSAWSGDDVYSDGYVEWLEEMIVKTLSIAPVSYSEAELKAKFDEQKDEIREWLIGEDFDGLAERL